MRVWVKRSEVAGKKGSSQWVSQHFIHYMFNQIYVQGHQCVTGRLIVLQSGGDRRRNVWSSGNKEGGRSIPRGVWRWTFAQKHFQSVLWFADASVQPHCVTSHNFEFLIDKQKHDAAIWGEMSNLRNVLVVPSSLNSNLAFTNRITVWEGNVPQMCIDYVTNMIPITDDLYLIGNALLFLKLFFLFTVFNGTNGGYRAGLLSKKDEQMTKTIQFREGSAKKKLQYAFYCLDIAVKSVKTQKRSIFWNKFVVDDQRTEQVSTWQNNVSVCHRVCLWL